jgi:hypothetical protein
MPTIKLPNSIIRADCLSSILAEATTKTSLRADSPLNHGSVLWLGNARVLRSWGLCDKVLDPVALNEGSPGIVIIKDLSQTE